MGLIELLTLAAANWEAIGTGIAALHTLALVIIQFTPESFKSDRARTAFRLIEVLAGLFTEKSRTNTPTAK